MEQLVELLEKQDESNLLDYLSRNNEKLISDWSYAAGTSNHADLGKLSSLIARILETCNASDSLRPVGANLIQAILKDHLRVIYRSLFLTRARQTIPAIHILQKILQYSKGSYVGEFYNSFDFSLKVIPKLLASAEFRPNFVGFILDFLQNAPAPVRKDVLSQKRLISGWLNRISDDEDSLVARSLEVLKAKVVADRFFSKTNKIYLFTTPMLANFGKLLSKSKEVASMVVSFLIYLFFDRENGIAFPDSGWSGDFHNKFALAFLKLLRPWEDVPQMDLSILFLTNLPELVNPYFIGLKESYSFSPKQTMFWYSYAVLIIRAIQLPIPELNSLEPPPADNVLASILPSPATKSALHAGITFASPLVQFQVVQIIIQALNKLKRVVNTYKERLWDYSQILDDTIAGLPDINTLLKGFELRLLQTGCLTGVKLYYEILSANPASKCASSLVPLPPAMVRVFDTENVKELAVVQALDILEIQSLALGPTKWWNKNKDTLSFFTRLVKFSMKNPLLVTQCAELLKTLTRSTLIFQRETPASPVDVLLYSLDVLYPRFTANERVCLWSLIDESVARAARAPYGYLDQFRVNVSPFAVALVEQFSFVEAKETLSSLKLWVASFIRDLGVIGENMQATDELLKRLNVSALELPQDDYFEFILTAPDKTVASRDDLSFKISTPMELMATIRRMVTSPQLAEFLMKSIPATMGRCLASAPVFENILSGGAHLVTLYLDYLRGIEVKPVELIKNIQQSQFWPLALDMLEEEFLVSQVRDATSRVAAVPLIDELTKRGVGLPLDLAERHLYQADHLKILELSKDDAKRLMFKTQDPKVIAALIQASKYFRHDVPKDLGVLLAASLYARDQMDDATVQLAIDLGTKELSRNSQDALRLVVCHASNLNMEQSQMITQYVVDLESALDANVARLVAKLDGFDKEKEIWLKKCVLQLTKVLAEKLSLDNIFEFIQEFNNLIEHTNIWSMVSATSVNALIEVAISRLAVGDLMYELVGRLVFSGTAELVDFAKHIQRILDGPRFHSPDARLKVNMTLWKLFHFDNVRNSTDHIQKGILSRYTATSMASDNLLLEILCTIETCIQLSWVNKVNLWQFKATELVNDDEISSLVTIVGRTMEVTLDKTRIHKTLSNYDPNATMVLAEKSSTFCSLKKALKEYDVVHPDMGYNDEFLLGCVISCDQIMKETGIDIKVLAETGLLQFTLCCLGSANTGVRDMAAKLLVSVAAQLTREEKHYKEYLAVTLLVNKALTFINKHARMPAHLAIILAHIGLVAVSPSHFLHEKISNWLLAGPSIQDFQIPLWKEIVRGDADQKVKEQLWLLNVLRSGLADYNSVLAYLKYGVFEWVYTLQALVSPKTGPTRSAAGTVLSKAIELGGSMQLITRAGALSYPVQPFSLLRAADDQNVCTWLGLGKEATV